MERDLRKLLRRIKREAGKHNIEILPPDLTGAAYDPLSKTIYGTHPVNLAHELGHALQHEEHPMMPLIIPAAAAGNVIPYIALMFAPARTGPKLSHLLRSIGITSLIGAGGYALARFLNHLVVKNEKDAWERAMRLAPKRVRPLMKEVAEKAVGTYRTQETNWPLIGTIAGTIGSLIAMRALKGKVPRYMSQLVPLIGLGGGTIYSIMRNERLRQEIEDLLFRKSKRH